MASPRGTGRKRETAGHGPGRRDDVEAELADRAGVDLVLAARVAEVADQLLLRGDDEPDAARDVALQHAHLHVLRLRRPGREKPGQRRCARHDRFAKSHLEAPAAHARSTGAERPRFRVSVTVGPGMRRKRGVAFGVADATASDWPRTGGCGRPPFAHRASRDGSWAPYPDRR